MVSARGDLIYTYTVIPVQIKSHVDNGLDLLQSNVLFSLLTALATEDHG
jgi:hypothetical protein